VKAIQFIIDGQFKDKSPLPKPESFVDTTIVDELEVVVLSTRYTSNDRAIL